MIYGNECDGGFILLRNGFVFGEYTQPQEIIITDLGEPYYTVTEIPIGNGQNKYNTYSRDGGGNIIALEVGDARNPTPVTFVPPPTEAGNWAVTSPNIEYWTGSRWGNYPGQTYYRTIYRYRVTINPA